MGMMSLDHTFARMINEVYNISTSALGPENLNIKPEQVEGSVYQKVWQSKEIVIVEDLKKAENNTEIEKIFMKKGIRSLLLYPSVSPDPRLNQIVELYSSKPNSFSHNSLQQLKALLPLVEAGLNRKREELDNGITSIIQDQFTNIHPSVYWKFRDTAINHLKKSERKLEDYSKLDPIAFSEVYPLYGQADIVSSSLHRNKAIQADLIDNLKL